METNQLADAINEQFGGAKKVEEVKPIEETAKVETPKVEDAVVKQEEVKKEEPKKEVENNKIDEEAIFNTRFTKFVKEKSGGKYEKFEDWEKELTTPKEVLKRDYANAEIERLDELARKGVKLDREFFELQSKDFEKMDAMSLHIEALKLDEANKGLSDKTLALKVKKQFALDEWQTKDIEDYTDDDYANKELFEHQANINKAKLNNYKNERTYIKEVSGEDAKAMAEAKRAEQELWEKKVDSELAGNVDKFSTETEDESTKEKISFEFAVPDEIKKQATLMMKQITQRGLDAYIGEHIKRDEKGNVTEINNSAVMKDYVKARIFDKAMEASLKQGIALGRLQAEKNLKNIDFEPEGKNTTSGKKQDLAEAIKSTKVF